MKKIISTWLLLSSACALALSVVAFTHAADAPADSSSSKDKPAERPALRGDRALGPFSPFDTNHDGALSSDEIDAIPAALRKLDKNGDGKLTADELRPKGPPQRRNGPGGPDGNDSDGKRGPRPEGDNGMPPPPPPQEN